ncbi:MAG: hypothetical protein GC191_00405 [Azospirillum sp.]|nr:hypothetical protein [Azospirillum sp.]
MRYTAKGFILASSIIASQISLSACTTSGQPAGNKAATPSFLVPRRPLMNRLFAVLVLGLFSVSLNAVTIAHAEGAADPVMIKAISGAHFVHQGKNGNYTSGNISVDGRTVSACYDMRNRKEGTVEFVEPSGVKIHLPANWIQIFDSVREVGPGRWSSKNGKTIYLVGEGVRRNECDTSLN